jgi:hypothetical protein
VCTTAGCGLDLPTGKPGWIDFVSAIRPDNNLLGVSAITMQTPSLPRVVETEQWLTDRVVDRIVYSHRPFKEVREVWRMDRENLGKLSLALATEAGDTIDPIIEPGLSRIDLRVQLLPMCLQRDNLGWIAVMYACCGNGYRVDLHQRCNDCATQN